MGHSALDQHFVTEHLAAGIRNRNGKLEAAAVNWFGRC